MKERLLKYLSKLGEKDVRIKEAESWPGGQKQVKDEEIYL